MNKEAKTHKFFRKSLAYAFTMRYNSYHNSINSSGQGEIPYRW